MDINRLAEVFERVEKKLDQLDHETERLDILQNYIEEVKEKLERLDQKTDCLYQTQIVETYDNSFSEGEMKDGRKLQGEIEQIKTSITSLAGHLDTVKKSMATVVKKIDSVEISLKYGHKSVLEGLLSVEQGQNLVTTYIEQSASGLKTYMNGWHREIVAVTEKQAQIVRDRIEGRLPSLGKYFFDCYVKNFKNNVRSEGNFTSPAWYINEAKTNMKGCVEFQADGNIDVQFIYGRHPREVGLQPRPSRRFRVKATICDVKNKVLPDIVVGERTGDMDEKVILGNALWGWSLGVTSCDDLINEGYGEKEGYWWGVVLTRYDVTVL